MIGSMLTLWLRESGISRTEIGYAGLIFTVYALNFLWSPLLDQVRIRILPRLGQRRNWIVLCQLTIIGACFSMSLLSPENSAKAVVLVGLIIAFSSATQDIAIDAYRVDLFKQNEAGSISAAAAAATAGWWTGFAGLGYLPLALSDMGWQWPQLYLLLAVVSAGFTVLTLFSPDPPERSVAARDARFSQNITIFSRIPSATALGLTLLMLLPLIIAVWAIAGSPGLPTTITANPLYIPGLVILELSLLIAIITGLGLIRNRVSRSGAAVSHPRLSVMPAFLCTTAIAPLEEFFKRNGVKFAIGLLAFVLLFKIGEAFLGRMSIVFYTEIGFSNTEIATYSKMVTWWVTVAAAIPCGLLNARFGLVKGLMISGICMAASNLLFSLIAVTGPDLNLYLLTIIVDGITTAWGSVAFVSFISMLCNHAFSATQYALLASLGNLGRTTLASFSGQMVDGLGGNWSLFFIITAFMVTPSLILLWVMKDWLISFYKLGGTGTEPKTKKPATNDTGTTAPKTD